MSRWHVYGALAAGVLLVLGLVLVRMWHTGSIAFKFMGWNLFLAGLPLVFAWQFERARRGVTAVIWGGLWLLFLPNAPYIVTDFVHLKPNAGVPFWYDMLLLFTGALVGLLLGLVSLGVVHGRVARQFGGRAGWLLVLLACGLAGLGVAIGRYLDWNSWDVFVNPLALARDVVLHLATMRILATSGLLGALLLLGFVVLQGFSPTAE